MNEFVLMIGITYQDVCDISSIQQYNVSIPTRMKENEESIWSYFQHFESSAKISAEKLHMMTAARFSS